MANTLQELAIQQLEQEYGKLEREGFIKSMRSIIAKQENIAYRAMNGEFPTVVPDAYKIINTIEEGFTDVVIFEIEDTNPLSEKKLYDLAMLWCELDFHNIRLWCMVFDRYGQNGRPIELQWFYNKFIQKDVATGIAPKIELEQMLKEIKEKETLLVKNDLV